MKTKEKTTCTEIVDLLIKSQGFERVVMANALMKNGMSVEEVCKLMDEKEATKTTES